VAVVACGPMVWEALVAAEELEKEGIDVRVVNVATIKPLDEETILAAARDCGAIVSAEEHQVTAGLGGAVSELLAKKQPTPMEFVGVNDTYGGSGEPDELMEYFGLTSKAIVEAIRKVLKRKG